MNNFWKKLKKPIIALAPMAGITDFAFREICADFGADILYSEMANVTALKFQPKKTLEMIGKKNRKSFFVVQLFGSNPGHFAKAVRVIEKKIGPDGIDINFGCPAPKVLKTGAGAELMKDLDLSYNVIKETIKNTKLPVSIKTRIKSGEVSILEFMEKMKDLDIKAIMIHGRTLSQGFSGNIDYKILKKIKNNFKGVTLVNGGINNIKDVDKILKKTNADGVGIARGCMGNPWIFSQIKDKKYIKTPEQIFYTILRHARLAKKEKGSRGIIEMRKHLCWYVQGFKNAKTLRRELVKVETINNIKDIFLDNCGKLSESIF